MAKSIIGSFTKGKKQKPMKFLIKHTVMRFHWQIISIIVLSQGFIASHGSLRALIISKFVDEATALNYSKMEFYGILFIGLNVILTIMYRLYDYAYLKFIPVLKANAIKEVANNIMEHSYRFFQNYMPGFLMRKIQNVSHGIHEVVQVFMEDFCRHGLNLVVTCITLGTIHVYFSAIMAIWLFLFLAITYAASFHGNKLSFILAESESKLSGKMVDIMINMQSVRLFANRKYENINIEKWTADIVTKEQRLEFFFLYIGLVQGFISTIFQGVSIFLLYYLYKNNSITIGSIPAVLSINNLINDSLFSIANELPGFAEHYGEFKQGLESITCKPEIEDQKSAENINLYQGKIEFKNVSFGYNDDKKVIKNCSTIVNPNEKIGLVGFSGAGKSTFVNLILRMFDPQSGKVLIDDQDISKFKQTSLRKNISFIPQEPIVFQRSIFDNIKYGKMDATREEVYEAAKKAEIHNFIMSLKNQYSTKLGDNAMQLSGGQKQRIIIARTFLENAKILILDEATSSLDSVTEKSIQKSLKKLSEDKTTIIIAHRFSTLLDVDRILVFDNEKIVQNGPHNEIIKDEKGLYKILWDSQKFGFLPD